MPCARLPARRALAWQPGRHPGPHQTSNSNAIWQGNDRPTTDPCAGLANKSCPDKDPRHWCSGGAMRRCPVDTACKQGSGCVPDAPNPCAGKADNTCPDAGCVPRGQRAGRRRRAGSTAVQPLACECSAAEASIDSARPRHSTHLLTPIRSNVCKKQAAVSCPPDSACQAGKGCVAGTPTTCFVGDPDHCTGDDTVCRGATGRIEACLAGQLCVGAPTNDCRPCASGDKKCIDDV